MFTIRLAISLFCLASLAAAFAAEGDAAKKSYAIVVSAGEFDRKETPVCIASPNPAQTQWTLLNDAGAWVGSQQDARKQLWFIVPELKAGQSKTYTLREGRVPMEPLPFAVKAAKDGGAVKITVADKEVLRYQGEKTELPKGFQPQYQRGGYIHPVLTPSGKLVTDDYPPKHMHHHGIWTPWTKTEFEGRHPDFWNMGGKTGTVEFVALDDTWSGYVFAGIKARHKQVDLSAKPEPKTALNETWELMVFNVGSGEKKYNLFELTVTQECASASPLTLPKYHYGGTGIRGNRQWDGAANCDYLTSEGITRKDKEYAKPDGPPARARWCHMGGKVDGAPAGIAMLDHPANFRAPQALRLHPDEPFIGYCTSKLGDWSIEPGKPYAARYRYVVADGPADKAELDRLWNDFATPPKVEVK